MELKELKCKNCGAKVEVDENATQATCKYCNTTFAIEDEYSAGYKYTKGVLKAKDEQYEKDMEKMIDLKVDMIITNYPNILKEVLENKYNKV